MKLAPAIMLAAPALLLLPLAATASAQADPDNPPVETIKSITGEAIRIQRFPRAPFDIDPATLRIGQRKMLRAAYGDLVIRDHLVRLECPATAFGRLAGDPSCRAASGAEADLIRAVLAVRLLKITGAAFPTIPQVPLGKLRSLQRVVQFDVRIKAFPAAEPEPPEGALVESKDVNGLSSARTNLDYPPAALRREAEGRMIAACQIQADLSVACTQERFEPAENAALFAPAATSLFQAGKVDPLLASGARAEGARFRFAVNFTLPK